MATPAVPKTSVWSKARPGLGLGGAAPLLFDLAALDIVLGAAEIGAFELRAEHGRASLDVVTGLHAAAPAIPAGKRIGHFGEGRSAMNADIGAAPLESRRIVVGGREVRGHRRAIEAGKGHCQGNLGS